jgi:hypothetical protein
MNGNALCAAAAHSQRVLNPQCASQARMVHAAKATRAATTDTVGGPKKYDIILILQFGCELLKNWILLKIARIQSSYSLSWHQ